MRVVFLCGGLGTRLWPESRESLPKQFISLFNEKSLLDLTVERVLQIIKKNKPIFICNQDHGFLVKKTIEKYKLNADIFLEPEGKNTCAAIYLAAKHCSAKDNLLILPSDHLVLNAPKFINDVKVIENNLLNSEDFKTLQLVIGDASKTTLDFPDPDILLIDSCHDRWFGKWYTENLLKRVKDLSIVQDILFLIEENIQGKPII